MINMPVFFLMVLFPEMIIKILFGQDYIVATNSLRFLAFGSLFSSIFLVSQNLVSMAGKSKIIFYDVIFVSFLNVILNISIIPRQFIFGMDNSLGITGAAIATSFSLLVLSFLFLIQARHYTSAIPLKKEMFKIFLASLFSCAAMIILKNILETTVVSFIFMTMFFLLIYLLLLFLLRVFDEEDRMILKNIKNKIHSKI